VEFNETARERKEDGMSTEQTDRHEPETAKPQKPAWIAGGVLILVGLAFIARDVIGIPLHNWWALFILIPAIGSLVTSYQMFVRNDRRFTAASQGPLIGGIVLLGVTCVFLFNLDWGRVWPVFLILVGLGILLGALRRNG
jgi:hypothetical protein